MKVLIALMTLILLGVGGCTSEPAPSLRVAGNVWSGYEPLYLARDLGLFKAADVHPVEYTSATQVIRAYQNDAIDAACLTIDEALLLASHDEDFRIVLVADFSNGADAILGGAGITRITDLKGRRVGVEDTALGAFFLQRALRESNLGEADVTVVPLEVQLHERAFLDRRVDAVATFDPVRSRLLARGAHVLFDSSRIPGEIVDVVLVRRSYLERYPDNVTAMLQGWLQAMRYMVHDTDGALQRVAQRESLSPQTFRAALQGLKLPDREENLRLLSGAAPELHPAVQRLADFMAKSGLLRRNVDVRSLIDSRPLRATQS